MSTSIKGDKTIKVKGRKYKMRADFACIEAIEEEEGKTIGEILQEEFPRVSMSLYSRVLFHLLAAFGPQNKVETSQAAGQLLVDGGMESIVTDMTKCIAIALGQQIPELDGDEGNQPAPKKAAAA